MFGRPDRRLTSDQEELAWRFRELADRHGGWTVFYEVGVERLPLYIDLGLTLYEAGRGARAAGVVLAGQGATSARCAGPSADGRDGGSFQVVPAKGVPPLMPELRAISEAWLREGTLREKGFSLGRFDARLRRPVFLLRVVREQGGSPLVRQRSGPRAEDRALGGPDATPCARHPVA